MYVHKDRQTERQTDRQTDRQAGRHVFFQLKYNFFIKCNIFQNENVKMTLFM